MRISDRSSDVCSSDLRHRGVGLGVVDRGRLAEQAEVGRERRLVARLALLAFQRLHQRGFLAADVGARAKRVGDVDVDAAAEDVRISEETLSEIQSLMRISYAVLWLDKKNYTHHTITSHS